MRQYKPIPILHPTIPLIDDSDAPNAGNFNVAPEALADNIAFLLQGGGNADALNWPHSMAPWTQMQPTLSGLSPALVSPTTAPVWDRAYARWLLGVQNNAAFGGAVYYSADGYTWFTETKPLTPNILGLAVKNDGTVLVIGGSSNPGTVPSYSTQRNVATGVYSTVTMISPSTAFPTPQPGNWYSGVYHTPTNAWVFWQGGSGAAAMWSADGLTWTNVNGWAPPAGFLCNTVAWIATPGSPTHILVFPYGPVNTAYMLTTDGVNWSSQAMPALNAGEVVVDACYDTQNGLYCMLTSTMQGPYAGAGGVSRVWQSITGFAGSWTAVATLNHTSALLRCDEGGQLLAWVNLSPSTSTNFTNTWRAIQAASLSPSTWGVTQLYDAFPPAPSTSGVFALASSGSQFLYVSARTGFAPSEVIGPVTILAV